MNQNPVNLETSFIYQTVGQKPLFAAHVRDQCGQSAGIEDYDRAAVTVDDFVAGQIICADEGLEPSTAANDNAITIPKPNILVVFTEVLVIERFLKYLQPRPMAQVAC